MNHLRPLLLVLALGPFSLAGCDDATSTPVAPEPPVEASDPQLFLLGDPGCPDGYRFRSPEQVLAEHHAALAIGDFDALDCNYAEDAVLVGDGGIATGHDEIRNHFDFFVQLYGGTMPVVVQQISVQVLHEWTRSYMVRELYTIDTPCVTVPDGINTYVIRFGQIRAQTSHGFPVFPCL